ncbi:ferrous iron transporter B [Cryptosporangium arvum]|uniref:ferrous iron transporter B n=1 Tax=Cryptosporangium arvum TaxID=80871 RepID=UPI0004ACA9EB|nr:ferrous iron transporter B [Cryptosporangium arvum]
MTGHDCDSCGLSTLPVRHDVVVALAGNPNSGKSTLFNALTGLRQRVGNWSGTTVSRAEGTYRLDGTAYRVVDLPGVTSFWAAGAEERVAAEFLLGAEADVTVVVVDALRLERHLYLVLQLLRITRRVVVALNMIDEAERAGVVVDVRHLNRELGVPVVPVVARTARGVDALLAAVATTAREPRAPGGTDVEEFSDDLVTATFADAERLATEAVGTSGRAPLRTFDQWLDRALTHRVWGFATMGAMFFGVFWLTIAGAAVPSDLLFALLVDHGHPLVRGLLTGIGAPGWLVGLTADGVYLGTAWVIAVMLPPMAIFFPLFTLLEDFGYLPRVAFNLDRLFHGSGAHGKQALTMMMGYGCNAAGVTATRIIDSPRERLIAIVTNNFSICNGRWPTLILMGTVFVGSVVPPVWAGVVGAATVVAVAVLGVVVTLAVSWLLSRTVLRGEVSVYSLELPPYRRPQLWRTIYVSLIDRTVKVLRRAVVMAAPAGALIWIIGNVDVGGVSVAVHLVRGLDPVGMLLGLNGVVLLAYVVAVPANEIVVPAILMLTLAASGTGPAGVLIDASDTQAYTVLAHVGGWTVLTAVNLMLLSLLHNPCSTTILTIWKETRSLRWTSTATLLPLALGVLVTFTTATLARWL